MRTLRCKCGDKTAWTSMGMADCQGCEKCQTTFAKPVIVVERSYIGKDWVASYPPTTTGDNSPQECWNIVFQGTLPECEAWISLREKKLYLI